jgi:tryptophan 2,3-dioxygenase
MDVDQSLNYCLDEFIKKKFPNKDIQNFLIKHERRELFIKNMKRELHHARPRIHTGKQLQNIIMSMVSMFCNNALETKEKELGGNGKSKSLD